MIDLFIVLTNDGRDELAKFFTGITDAIPLSYFKLGEGGWTQSALETEETAEGDGGATYSGTLNFSPVVHGTLTIEDTVGGQSVTDTPNSPYDGEGTLSGDGTGTINYKTGDYEVTFDSAVAASDPIEAQYRHWGSRSELKTYADTEDDDPGIPGNGTAGPYSAVLRYARFGVRIAQGTITVSDGGGTPQTLTDDGAGNLTGNGSGSVDYESGEIDFTFTNAVPTDQTIQITYRYDGAPDIPGSVQRAYTDIESESDPELYTFQKSFTIIPANPTRGDIWEEDRGRLRVKVRVEPWEAMDDGNGNPPSFFEGGIFLANDVMLAYFTYTKAPKYGSTEIQFYLDEVL